MKLECALCIGLKGACEVRQQVKVFRIALKKQNKTKHKTKQKEKRKKAYN
jgi:hypothetical protein